MTESIKKHAFTIQIGTAVIVILFISGFVATWISWKKDVDASIAHVKGKTDLYVDRYEKTIEDQQGIKVDIAKIQTQLASIETMQAMILKELQE